MGSHKIHLTFLFLSIERVSVPLVHPAPIPTHTTKIKDLGQERRGLDSRHGLANMLGDKATIEFNFGKVIFLPISVFKGPAVI